LDTAYAIAASSKRLDSAKDRISSDEEERGSDSDMRSFTAIRFEEACWSRRIQTGKASSEGEEILALDYGQAATLWRINLGWKRRENKLQYGFVLDLEAGYWQKSDLLEATMTTTRCRQTRPSDPLRRRQTQLAGRAFQRGTVRCRNGFDAGGG